jgi:hypothetical protein
MKMNRSSKDILANVAIKALKPKEIKSMKLSDSISKAINWANKNIKEYLLVVVDENDKFRAALADEAVYQYIMQKKDETAYKGLKVDEYYQKIGGDTLGDLIDFFEASKNKELVRLTKYAVELSEDMTADAATQKLEEVDTYLGVILDANRKPTGYISTNDLRKYLMNY